MPAPTPEEVIQLFSKYFSARDIDALISLYEPGATMVPQPGATVHGSSAIREALTQFLALEGRLNLEIGKVIEANDIALVFSKDYLGNRSAGERSRVSRSGVRCCSSPGRWDLAAGD
jgi:ketosteroid isomerase-like protein